MIKARALDLYGVDCTACGTESVGGDVFAVPGFHVTVYEVCPDEQQWRTADLFFCSRRCVGKHVADGLTDEDWQPAEALYAKHTLRKEERADHPGGAS